MIDNRWPCNIFRNGEIRGKPHLSAILRYKGKSRFNRIFRRVQLQGLSTNPNLTFGMEHTHDTIGNADFTLASQTTNAKNFSLVNLQIYTFYHFTGHINL